MRSALTIVAWLAASSTVSAQNFQFTQIDVPGARLTRPFGLNASGQIVGVFQDASGASHGFMRNPDDTYTTFDVPGAIFTNAGGINARGDIVGRWTDAAHVNHLYLRTSRGDYRTFDPLAPCVASPLPRRRDGRVCERRHSAARIPAARWYLHDRGLSRERRQHRHARDQRPWADVGRLHRRSRKRARLHRPRVPAGRV